MDLEQKLIHQYQTSQNLKKQINELEKEHIKYSKYKHDLENELYEKQQEIKKEKYRKFKEYLKRLDFKEAMSIRIDEVAETKLVDPNVLEEIDNIKLELEQVTHKANSSWNEWNYLKDKIGAKLMEEEYAKDQKEN